MAFIPVANTAQVVINQRLHGEEVVNVLHFSRAGGFPLASLGALATLVATNWIAEILPHLSADLTLESVVARDLSVADGQQAVQSVSPAEEGGIGQPALPGQVAFVITHRTAFIGRSRRGRTYLAGLGEDDVTANTFLTVRADALAQGFNDLRVALASAGFFFAIVSRYTGGAPRATGLTTAVDVSVARDYTVDTQRGRLRGTGLG